MDRSLVKLRTRWAAIGAAVAVTLGAGGIGIVSATVSSGERTVFVPISPCRMADTRSGSDNVGPRATPLGDGEEYVIQARGPQGNCDLPPGATGIVANVTAINATLPTNLRLMPTGGTPPLVSNLNPRPGAPPTPNAVTTDLNPAGQFSIINFRGTVDVIVDIAGYYEDHDHPRTVTRVYTASGAASSDGTALEWINGCIALPSSPAHATLDLQLPVGAQIQSVEVRVDLAPDPSNGTLTTWLVAITGGSTIVESDASDVAHVLWAEQYEEVELDLVGRSLPFVTQFRTYVVRARGDSGFPNDYRLCGAKVVYTEPA